MYNDSELEITLQHPPHGVTLKNNQWNVEEISVEVEHTDYGEVGVFTSFSHVFKVRRQVAFLYLVLLLPAILLSVLTTAVFSLPPDHPEKINVG